MPSLGIPYVINSVADMDTLSIGENHLSFIETSALDASNVELAFQNILTGPLSPKSCSRKSPIL
jgi:hypothetical protein